MESELIRKAPGEVYIRECPWFVRKGTRDVLNAGLSKGYPIAYTRIMSQLQGDLLETLSYGGGTVFVVGPPGVGKSVAVTRVLCDMIGARVPGYERTYEVIVVDVDIKRAEDPAEFIESANKAGYYPILYLDPSPVQAYSPKKYAPRWSLSEVKSAVIRFWETADPNERGAASVIVVTDDLYEQFGLINFEGAAVKVGADVKEAARFARQVAALIEVAGWGFHMAGDIVKEKFPDAYYAVAAAVAARNARGREDKPAEEEVEREVYTYALQYTHWLFGGDVELLRRAAPVLLALGFGVDAGAAASFVEKKWGQCCPDVIGWIKLSHNSAIRGALEFATRVAAGVALGTGGAVLDWAPDDVRRFIETIASELAEFAKRRQCDFEALKRELAAYISSE